MQVPSWLRCENCIFYSFSGEISFFNSITYDKEHILGCIHPDVSPQIHSCFYRCPKWVCRRCLMSLETIIINAPEIDNHSYCKRAGRSKKNKNTCGFVEEENESMLPGKYILVKQIEEENE